MIKTKIKIKMKMNNKNKKDKEMIKKINIKNVSHLISKLKNLKI